MAKIDLSDDLKELVLWIFGGLVVAILFTSAAVIGGMGSDEVKKANIELLRDCVKAGNPVHECERLK